MTEQTLNKAIGILGGTFDPIHYGHLRPALDLVQQLDLAEVRLMPNHIPPHRTQPGCSAKHRAAMTALAIQDCPELTLDDRELKRNSASYSIDTLQELYNETPHTPICFLIGLDSLNTLHTWHRWQELLNYCHLVVSYRPNYRLRLAPEVQELFDRISTENPHDLHTSRAGRILLWPTTQLDISATRIRHLLQSQQSPKYLLPDAVLTYIEKNKLYI